MMGIISRSSESTEVSPSAAMMRHNPDYNVVVDYRTSFVTRGPVYATLD
jgi:hypothetical protein